MTNSMPTYAVFHHRAFMGYVSAVSYAQAESRAAKRFGKRVEVEIALNVKVREQDRIDCNIAEQCKRAPYDVGDFEARRQAEIDRWKAAQAA